MTARGGAAPTGRGEEAMITSFSGLTMPQADVTLCLCQLLPAAWPLQATEGTWHGAAGGLNGTPTHMVNSAAGSGLGPQTAQLPPASKTTQSPGEPTFQQQGSSSSCEPYKDSQRSSSTP